MGGTHRLSTCTQPPSPRAPWPFPGQRHPRPTQLHSPLGPLSCSFLLEFTSLKVTGGNQPKASCHRVGLSIPPLARQEFVLRSAWVGPVAEAREPSKGTGGDSGSLVEPRGGDVGRLGDNTQPVSLSEQATPAPYCTPPWGQATSSSWRQWARDSSVPEHFTPLMTTLLL